MAIKSSDVKLELKNTRETIENASIDPELKKCLMSIFKVISIHTRMDIDTRTNTTQIMNKLDIALSTVS